MPRIHECRYRISYADTDRMDRVYYANYLVIAERARTEFLRDVGHPYREFERSGSFFPVRSCEVRYYGFASYDDELVCRSRIAKMTHATLAIVTDMCRPGEAKPLVVARVELACVGENGRPRALPDALRAAVDPYLAPEARRD
ncbi:MAG: acyl-CoA thioesterase [Planctomycetota bacterium]|jgi:acyl-CoA thioester hydrolase|nr:acyl-CoA thioesterase [Planctomycetota bacterium]